MEGSGGFELCRPLVISSLAVDEVVYSSTKRILLGGPSYHSSWIGGSYSIDSLTVTGIVNYRDYRVFFNAVKERGSRPLLYRTREQTARVVLDYTTGRRRVWFKSYPPQYDEQIIGDLLDRVNPLITVVNPMYNEISIELIKFVSSKTQWSVLDLQGYLRSYKPGDILSTMPKRMVDVIHLSTDDLPRKTFDYLIDEIASIARHTILYTLGSEGAVLLDSNGTPRLRARPRETSNKPSTGAGDVFAFAYGLFLCLTWDPRKSFIEALMTSMYYALNKPAVHKYNQG